MMKREGVYYLRVKVPAVLREAGLIRQREFKKSLGTSNLAEARRLFVLEIAKIDAEILEAHRQLKLQNEPIKTLTRSEMEHLAVQLLHQREANRFSPPDRSNKDRRPDEKFKFPDPKEVEEATISHDEALADAEDWLEQLQRPDDPQVAGIVSYRAKKFLKEKGIELAEGSPELRYFNGLVRRVLREEAERSRRELKQDFSNAPGDVLFQGITGHSPLPGKHDPARAGTWTLTKLIETFRKEPDQLALAPKSKVSHAARDRIYAEILGAETYITDIKRKDVAKLVSLLSRLPANATKRFPGLTATQVAEKADKEGHAPMTRKNASQYLSNLHTVFGFAVRSGLLEHNPVAGLTMGTDGVPDDEQRHPFSADQLKAIFSAPLFTGCVDDERGFNKPGPNRPRRARFWLPLIALTHGLRMNEIAQLYVEDIEEMDGHHVIVIRKTDAKGGKTEKTLKTKNAKRYVPLHPEIVKIGFLDHVENMRKAKQVRLFPEVQALKSTGMYSGTFSKSFAYFLKSTGAKEDKTTFHSFRHNFTNALRAGLVGRDNIRILGGWAGGSTEDRYGSGLPVSILAEAIAKTTFPVDLSHLHTAPAADE
ncbi:site-specific integrase [Shinella zoogloeoides]|uniref:Tyrosine-type recombinase/integrase n=1 Tax=Shinella zoogloeoides TaxID=352475 RepID=A0A6N8TJD7_SHIZO|nr:site-specific integrase [Shinella zoogloeoides]MXO01338.1 tyrosine-type recombinase/integrase [Shinella zoogloeoides]UEX81565.1 site-specific integrase [Shinella zoogloeoides]